MGECLSKLVGQGEHPVVRDSHGKAHILKGVDPSSVGQPPPDLEYMPGDPGGQLGLWKNLRNSIVIWQRGS